MKMVLLLLGLCVVWAAQLIYVIALEIAMPFYPLWIGMSAMIYWLGHVGIYKYGA